jgi:hypothetical protein
LNGELSDQLNLNGMKKVGNQKPFRGGKKGGVDNQRLFPHDLQDIY